MTQANPSVGLDATTGGTITGWDHVLQSLVDIFTTHFGTRVVREWYGSFVPNLLGQNLNTQGVLPWFMAITSAIEQWEPRYRVSKISIDKVTRDGELHFFIDGEYRPRAVYGDLTPEGARRVYVTGNPDGLLIQQRKDEG